MRRTLLLPALLSIGVPASATAEVYEVSDATSLSDALALAAAADTIVLADGTYTLEATLTANLEGSSGAPIAIEAAAGARPVLQGPAGSPALALTATFATIRGLVFSGGSSAIRCDACANVLIADSEFSGTGPDPAVDGVLVDDSQLSNNWIHDTQGPGIVLNGAGNGVYDSVFTATTGLAISVSDAAESALGSDIAGNFVRGGGIVLVGAGAIRNNVVADAPQSGITSDLGAAGAADVFVVHNTVFGAAVCFSAIDWPLSAGATVLANNALYCEGAAATLFESGVGQNAVVTSNVYVGTSDFPGDSVLGVGAADFEDAATGNFFPAEASPLLDIGEAAYAASIDFNGAVRDVPPDVGAYERIGSTNPFPNPEAGFKLAPEPPGGGDDMGSSDDSDAGSTGTNSGSGPVATVGSPADGYPERDESGCQCSAANGPGSGFLILLMLLYRGLPLRLFRKKNSAA